ncbi:hypothetical protein OG21DRAFT_1528335 [Imleria badia]|nr:hypothetical protein OG21DRAFT_1528335 [Imleria badia]
MSERQECLAKTTPRGPLLVEAQGTLEFFACVSGQRVVASPGAGLVLKQIGQVALTSLFFVVSLPTGRLPIGHATLYPKQPIVKWAQGISDLQAMFRNRGQKERLAGEQMVTCSMKKACWYNEQQSQLRRVIRKDASGIEMPTDILAEIERLCHKPASGACSRCCLRGTDKVRPHPLGHGS